MGAHQPDANCELCPRLRDFRAANRAAHGAWFNRPVPSFGSLDATRLIVGLAPGLRGANRTGRPFQGDHAGGLLYTMLLAVGLASGAYRPDDPEALSLGDCRITNAVRCVPPENKPKTAEIAACRPFLVAEIAAMPRLHAILCLGRIAHASTVAALGMEQAAVPFAHGRAHRVAPRLTLIDSYHCSRQNTSTGRLTADMFRSVIDAFVAAATARDDPALSAGA